MDLLLAHGADVNAQVTGTQTYSLRISRAPSSTEGMTALHVAAQKGRADEVRYLLAKGAKTDLLDSSGPQADRFGRRRRSATRRGGHQQQCRLGCTVPAAGGGAASAAEIRALLQNAPSPK